MEYKPILFPITKTVAMMNQNVGLDVFLCLGAIVETISQINRDRAIPSIYGCGKQDCTGFFALVSNTERPIVCPKCGSKIDWSGIATKNVKRCPNCNKVGSEWESFCKYHDPAIALKESEEPL
ncbi:MAG: hypothetical protein AAB296_09935 [Candidatus Desantisbacteria bacterium]